MADFFAFGIAEWRPRVADKPVGSNHLSDLVERYGLDYAKVRHEEAAEVAMTAIKNRRHWGSAFLSLSE